MRYTLARDVQRAADEFYGGDRFPDPAQNLLRTVQRDVPNVVGRSIDEATSILDRAGFNVTVGDPVDAEVGGDRVAEQSPSGTAAAGSTITIRPGNGQGGTVPDVTGQNVNVARATLLSAGYGTVSIGACREEESAPAEGEVTGMNPAANSSANKSTNVTLDIVAKDCP
jgi:hypothetical protein